MQNSHNILIFCLEKDVWQKTFFGRKKNVEWLKKFLIEKSDSFLIVFFQATVSKSLYTPAEHFKYIMDRGTEKGEEHAVPFL